MALLFTHMFWSSLKFSWRTTILTSDFVGAFKSSCSLTRPAIEESVVNKSFLHCNLVQYWSYPDYPDTILWSFSSQNFLWDHSKPVTQEPFTLCTIRLIRGEGLVQGELKGGKNFWNWTELLCLHGTSFLLPANIGKDNYDGVDKSVPLLHSILLWST